MATLDIFAKLFAKLPQGVTDVTQVEGAHQIKADTSARDAIPSYIRWVGMTCYTIAEGKSWRLVGGILNANWTEVVNVSAPTFQRVTTAGPIAIPDGTTLEIEYSSEYAGGAITYNLPTTGLVAGMRRRIKDGLGTAPTNNITVNPSSNTIDGASGTFVYGTSWESYDFQWTGSTWALV
jgi:hypothetical protein